MSLEDCYFYCLDEIRKFKREIKEEKNYALI